MSETIRLTTIEGGGNWWKVINWAAAAFREAGFEIDLARHGADGLDNARRIAAGEADVTVTLASGAWMAAAGRGAYADGALDAAEMATRCTSLAPAFPSHSTLYASTPELIPPTPTGAVHSTRMAVTLSEFVVTSVGVPEGRTWRRTRSPLPFHADTRT